MIIKVFYMIEPGFKHLGTEANTLRQFKNNTE